ncbi:MAG TPA: FMN-binding protein [Solirubrobacteraceae bacterium]|nr:FMN-binding protein [Solirubrobacteraceae bacterium]
MGRVVLLVVTAVVGLVAVLSFHTSTPQLALATAGQPASQRKQQPKAAATSASPSGSSNSIVLVTRSAVGASEQYGYGALSVRVTVRGNRIENVTVNGLQTAEQYSQQLAAQVIPTLHSEVLAAQSARINGISGASYTCQAYALSVQSALDKLHV